MVAQCKTAVSPIHKHGSYHRLVLSQQYQVQCPNKHSVIFAVDFTLRLLCISKRIIVVSDNGLLPDWCQAFIWTIAGSLVTNFSEILIQTHIFSSEKISFENVVLKIATTLSRPQCVNWWRSCDTYLCNRKLGHQWFNTLRSPFTRRHFQMHFSEWKCFNFD